MLARAIYEDKAAVKPLNVADRWGGELLRLLDLLDAVQAQMDDRVSVSRNCVSSSLSA